MKVFAAHNPDAEIRRQSSSGGVFSMLAEKVIDAGGVVYGAAFNERWEVEHRRVDTVEGLQALRGSKYVFSKVGTAYADAIADLASGRKVLFSGTPCQVAAMAKRAGKDENLLLIEVVCHGAPEPGYWTRYLDELCLIYRKSHTDISSINFRDKRTGWKSYSFTVKFNDGSLFTNQHDDNLYMRAFLQDFTLRDACFKCPFKYPDGSKADITLGDLWGISYIAPQLDNDLGASLVIIRSHLGESFFSTFQESDKAIAFNEVVMYNPAIIQSAIKPGCYSDFKHQARTSHSIIKVFRKYAAVPLTLKIKQTIYRLLHK